MNLGDNDNAQDKIQEQGQQYRGSRKEERNHIVNIMYNVKTFKMVNTNFRGFVIQAWLSWCPGVWVSSLLSCVCTGISQLTCLVFRNY